MPTRRAHKKSRLGCAECKRRKIKVRASHKATRSNSPTFMTPGPQSMIITYRPLVSKQTPSYLLAVHSVTKSTRYAGTARDMESSAALTLRIMPGCLRLASVPGRGEQRQLQAPLTRRGIQIPGQITWRPLFLPGMQAEAFRWRMTLLMEEKTDLALVHSGRRPNPYRTSN